MTEPSNWRATAFNPATESSNQIHSDAMAKAYGYRGGLVPGVVISGYLMNPGVVAWGTEWLNCGSADVKVLKPLYDGFQFEVVLSNVTDFSYDAELIDEEGTICATAHASLEKASGPLPVFQNAPLLARETTIPNALPEEMKKLQQQGMKSLVITWDKSHRFAHYLKDGEGQPTIHDMNANGYAHGAFMLGITNWVLAGNAYMNPWVHLQSESTFLKAVSFETNLIAECAITDLFSKKGHDFVDLNVNVFEAESHQAVMTANLRAIYRMRPA